MIDDLFEGLDEVSGALKATIAPRRESLYLKKALGQHFLRDREFARQIALALPKEKLIIEIGPGDGALTQELVMLGHPVIAIEIDADLFPILKKRFHRDNFSVIPMDVLMMDWRRLAAEKGQLQLAGNLPYNIATTMISRILGSLHDDKVPPVDTMVFTLQKEVADRLAATPGGRSYSALTLLTRYFCNVEYLFTIPADRFFPKPKVDGGVVRLKTLIPSERPQVSFQLYRRVVRGCFAQRRKMMRNSIRVVNGLPADWESLPFDWTRRPEDFSFEEIVALSIALEKMGLE